MARQTDLTKGNILHTLMQYAVPFIVSNVLQATYNITDMIIAGQYGGSSYAQSAIGNCTTVTSMLTQVIIGLATGGSILIGQYYGARREKEQRESTVTLFTMCLIIGVWYPWSVSGGQSDHGVDECTGPGAGTAISADLRAWNVFYHLLQWRLRGAAGSGGL